ncbi:MAG: tryptophan synthase subunit alpha [Chitinophagaceae bacterium]|nr:tryptophan synthase subunit alpha [Chitinophagaceae bacterium]
MNRILQLFERKTNNVLNVYCTAGYPRVDSTLFVMKALQDNGADIIELGMPYSDPLADGPVIQQSSMMALDNGMSILKLFAQLKDFRHQIYTPVILMGYMNPVLQYGFEKFCQHAADVAIDGLIIPDLPIHEFETEYSAIIKRYGLSFIFLITPETLEARIRKIDELSSGFIYAVSSSSTTGHTSSDTTGQQAYFKRIQDMKLKNPVLIGFGIRDKETFTGACAYANGAIIGSAYIKSLGNSPNIETSTKEFLSAILK